MARPFSHKPGEKATCNCEKGKATKSSSNPEKVGTSSKTADDNTRGGSDMETEEQLENLKSSTSLVKKFSGSCSLPSLVKLVPGEYQKDLLSNRLSGSEIKEAILIHLLGKIRMATQELPK